MQEARCEQQPNSGWRVWLHPSGREVAVYSDESEALDVTELINLKIKLDANLPTEGLTDDLDAGQIELVANMPMEELLQVVVPEVVDMDPDDAVNTAQKSYNQLTAQEVDKEDLEDDTSSSDEEDVVHHGTRSTRWQKNPDGSFSRIMGKGHIKDGKRICSWSLNDETRNIFVGEDSTDVVFIYRVRSTGKQQKFSVTLRGTIHNQDDREKWYSRNLLTKGSYSLFAALSLKQGDVVTLSKGPVMGQVYIDVDRCDNVLSKNYRQSSVSTVSSTDSEEELSEQEKPNVKVHYWLRNSDGSYSKVLPKALNSISISRKVLTDIFGSRSDDVVLITKSSVPELDNRQFKCQFYVNPNNGYSQLAKLSKVLSFLKAKTGHTITLSKGPVAGQAFISAQVQGGVPWHEAKRNPAKGTYWKQNRDGSYSKQLPPRFGTQSNIYLPIDPPIRRKLVRHNSRDFIMITKSADPDLDGKHFSVEFGPSQGPSQSRVWRGFRDVASCLNLQPYDIVTLSKGPTIGEVYITKGRKPLTTNELPTSPCGDVLGAADAHNGGLGFDDVHATHQNSPKSPLSDVNKQQSRHPNAAAAVAESHGGGVQKRQLPSSSNSDLQDSPPAKRNKTSTQTPYKLSVGHQKLQESDVAPETVVQGAAERSLPEMLALVKSIIDKEAVGLSAVERISYRTKFMIKMTPEIRVSSLQMLEELDGAGEHDGVKLCVQMSLQDLN